MGRQDATNARASPVRRSKNSFSSQGMTLASVASWRPIFSGLFPLTWPPLPCLPTIAPTSMSVLSRTFVPALALGLGTWLGLGRPDAQAALSAGAKAVASVTGVAHELAPKVVPPPPL